MKIIPSYSPRSVESTVKSEPVLSPRDKAIARLLGNAPQDAPAAPAANIASPEMAAAISSPDAPSPDASATPVPEATPAEALGQNNSNEGSVEPSQEDTTPDPKAPESQPLSAQYAQLARKEKAMRAHAQQIKAQEAALKAREEALAAKEAGMGSQYVPKERLTKETLAVLAEQGITYDQLTEQALEQQPDARSQAMIAKLEAKIAALEANQEKTIKSLEDNQKSSYEQAVNQIRNETKRLVASDPSFETIQASGAVEDVVELIRETFDNGLGDDYPAGTLLSVEEAAQMVEDHLVEEALKLANLKKIQAKLQKSASPAASAQPAATPPAQKQAPKPTLTNSVAASRPMTPRERAIAAAEGRLTK